MTPQIVQARTYHRRLNGPDNAFRYSLDYVLSEPEALGDAPRLLSRNRPNFASINDRDHGGPRGQGTGPAWVRELLSQRGLSSLAGCRILLLAQPRLIGLQFNPVSFWLIVDEADHLRAFIAEVNNTFGDRHSYLCHHPDLRPIAPQDRLTATKIFHVSPFQDTGGEYRFNIGVRPERISIRIDFRNGNGGLIATLDGRREPLTARGLLASSIRRPFGAARVLALIHWQALTLWLKGASFRSRPAPPAAEVS